METKSRTGSGSGIGRIFSLSLNQAISSNSRSPSGFDKSSKLLLLDVEKINSEGKPVKAPEIVTATSSEQTAGRTPDGQLSDTDVSRAGSISWICRPPGKLCSSPAIADSSSKTGASAVVNRKDLTVRSSEQIFSTGSKSTSRNKGSSYIAVRKAHGRAPPGSKTFQDSCATGTMSVGADKTSTEASPFKAKGQKAHQNGSRTAFSSCLEKWSPQPAVTVQKKDDREKRRKPRSKTSLVPSDSGVSKDTVNCKGCPTPPRSAVGACNSTASMRKNKEPHCFLPQRAAATDVGIESKQAPRASPTQRADHKYNSINRTDTRKEAAPQRADGTRTENMEISRSVATQSANDASRTGDEESLRVRPTTAQTDSAWTTRHKEALRPAATWRAHNANELENREVLRPSATQIADNVSRADNNLNKEDLAPAATQRADNARRKTKEVLRSPATQRADNASQTENKKVLRLDPTQRADNASRTKNKEAPKLAAVQRADIFDQTANREAFRAASAHGSWNAGGGTRSAIRSQRGMSSRIRNVESLRSASSAVPCIKRREIRHDAVERKSVITFNKKKKGGFPAAALITQQHLSSGNGTGDVQSSGGAGSLQLEFSYQGKPETVLASAELMKDQVLVSNNGSAGENGCKYCVDSASSKSRPEVITQIHAKCGESKSEYVAEILQCTDMGEALSAPRSVIETGTEDAGEISGKDILVPSPELDTETERDGAFVQSLECQDLNPQKCLTNLQTVPLARRRQASVSTRMRGNRRLRSSSHRKSQEEQDSKTEFQRGIKKVKSGTLVLGDDEQVKTVNGGKQFTDLGTSCMVEITDERGMSGACESGEIADWMKAPKIAVCNSKQPGEGIEQNDFAGSHSQSGQQNAAKGSGRGFFHTQSALEPVDNEKKSTSSGENTTMLKIHVSMEETVFFTTPGPSPTPADEASEKSYVRGGSFEFESTSDKNQVADGVAASAKAQTKQNKTLHGDGKLVISHGCASIMKRPSPLMSVQTKPTLGLWEQLHCQHDQPFFAMQHIEPSASSDHSIHPPTRPHATSLSESFKDPEVTSECTSPPHMLCSSKSKSSHTHSCGSFAARGLTVTTSQSSKELKLQKLQSSKDFSKSDCSKDTAESQFLGSPVSKNYQVSKCPSSQDPQKLEASKDCHILKCYPLQDLQKLETSKQSQFLGSPHLQEEEHHALEGVSSVSQPSQVIHKTAEKNMLEWEDRDLELTAVQSVPPEAERSVPPEAEQSVYAQSVSLSARLEGTAAGLAGKKLPVEPTQIQLEWVDRWRTAWERGTGSNGEDSGHTGAGGISVGETSKSDSLLPLLLERASQGMKDNGSKLLELSADTGTYNSDEPDLNLSDSVGLSPPLSFSRKEPRSGVARFPETESISQTADFPQRFSEKSEAKNQQSQVESSSHQAPPKWVSSRHRHSGDPRQNQRKESNGAGQFTLLKRENCKEQRPEVKRHSLCGSTATASRHHFASKSNDSDCLISSSSDKSRLASGSRDEKATQLEEKGTCHMTRKSEKSCPATARCKEAQDTWHSFSSVPGSEYSESLSVVSDHHSTRSTSLTLHDQASNSLDGTHVNCKELPEKSQSDSISSVSSKLAKVPFLPSVEKCFQSEEETQPDGDTTTFQACKKCPHMSLDRDKSYDSKRREPHKSSSTSSSCSCKQVHPQTGSKHSERKQVHPWPVASPACRDPAAFRKKLVHFHSQSLSGQNGRETLPLLATGEQHCREPVNSQKVTGNISGELAIPHVASDQTCMAHVFSQGASDETGRKSVSSQVDLKDIRKMPHTGTGSKSQPAAGCSQSHRDAACDHGVDCSRGCVARERLHSLTDSDLYPRVQTSSSSDCGSDLLSQSDCDDLAAQVQGNCRTEVMQERQPYLHYLRSCEFSEYWHKVYSGAYQNLSWYPPYTAESSNGSYYSPHPSDSGDCWMQPHDPYYERWYNAWLAYSMACYGYGFQGQEQGMGCNDEHECQDGCCSTAFQQLQQNRPSSRPASRPPSAMENPTQQDLNPMPRERSPIYPDNSGTSHRDASGNGSMDGADDGEAIHIPCHSIQTVNSARHPLDYVRKQTVEASSIPDVSFELIVRMKNESQAASGSPVHEEKTVQGSDLLETKDDVKTSSLQPDSPASPTTLADEDYTPMVQPPESSLHAMHPLWHFGARLPHPSRFPFGLNQPSCMADYCWPPRPQHPCPLVPAPLDPNPFCPLPTYPACRPRSATVTSSNSGNEEVKDGACGDSYSNLRQWPYSEWKEMPHYPDPSRFFHDTTQSSHLTPPTPAGSHPSFPETVTNLGPETSSSEIGPMDSSFDQRGDYDASGSDLEEEEGGAAGGAERLAQTESVFAHFVSAQKQRYLQMYKDSGSEDADSSSITSTQEPAAKRTSDAQGAISSASKYVIPNCRSGLGPGLSRYLEKRRIPSGGRGPQGRLCPSAVQVAPVTSSDCGESAAARKVACGAGVLIASPESPPTSSGGWWSKPAPPDGVLYDDHYPALPGTASPSLTPHFALGSYTKLPARNAAPHQPPSFRTVKEDGTCKTFFRKKPFLALDKPLSVSSCGQKASSYTSRLLKDSRVLGSSRWGKEAKEAFSRPYSSLFVDTHCHLDFLFNRQPYSGSFASYREKNKKTFPANFEGCVAVFCNPRSFTNESKWKPIVSEPRVWMAMGCHPKSALDYTEWAEMGLRQALKHKKTVALGEIGLDYSRHHGQYAAQQKEVFIRQIKMALEMQLPLVVHCREAEDDCLQILEEHVPVDYKIHCHCFTSNYDSALKWTSRFENLFIGLTPLVTYRSAVDTHEVARLLPLDKLLLETDAPYFLPCGFDGEGISLSHPGLALMVAIKVAELRCMDVEEVLSQVRRNTHHMYNI